MSDNYLDGVSLWKEDGCMFCKWNIVFGGGARRLVKTNWRFRGFQFSRIIHYQFTILFLCKRLSCIQRCRLVYFLYERDYSLGSFHEMGSGQRKCVPDSNGL